MERRGLNAVQSPWATASGGRDRPRSSHASVPRTAMRARAVIVGPGRRLPSFVLLLSVLLVASQVRGQPPAATGGALPGDRLSGVASLGFDSFNETYSIEEADTLDFSNEVRGAVGLTYRQPLGGAASFIIGDMVSLSGEAFRNIWNVGFEHTSREDDRLTLSNELSTRRFHQHRGEDAEILLSSDYTQNISSFFFRRRLSDVLRLDVRNYFEFIDFANETEYEYDYWRDRTGAGLTINPSFETSLEFALSFAYRSVPDSSAIDYRERGLRVEWWQAYGSRTNLQAVGEIERRRYVDEETRPGYFDLAGQVHLRVRPAERLELRLREELEIIDYDAWSQIYFSSIRNRLGIEGAVRLVPALEVGLEPRYTFLRADEDSGEDFDEFSAVVAADWLRLSGTWLRVALEFGRRDYREPLDTAIFSDYTLLRTNLFATVVLGGRTAWNTYLSYEPERHERIGDDTTIALISTDLTVRF